MIRKPRWRGDPKDLDPFCEWIRKEFPKGPEGYVSEDTDRTIRIFKSKNFPEEDEIGRYMDIERKHISVDHLERAKIMTHGLKDALQRKADPERQRYMGYYLLKMDDDNPYNATKFIVNGIEINYEMFHKWMGFEVDLKPYQFPRFISDKINSIKTKEQENPLWPILVETVHKLPIYPGQKACVRDRMLPEKPDISAKEIAFRLGLPLGAAMVILHELGGKVNGSSY